MPVQLRRYLIAPIALSLISLSSNAFAYCTEIDAAQALRNGEFELAAKSGAQIGTVTSRLIAAEALSAKVLLGMAEDETNSAKTALQLSASVLSEEPENKEAQFQYALADGFITRAAPPFKAWRKKLPQKTKQTVDALVENSPSDGRAHALRGAWHMGIIRETGEKNGAKWFGADAAAGQADYERALVLRPNDIIITSNYALSLAELDFDANGARARNMLINVLSAPPKDAVEREVQLRMRDVLTLWDDGAARKKRIKRFLDGGG